MSETKEGKFRNVKMSARVVDLPLFIQKCHLKPTCITISQCVYFSQLDIVSGSLSAHIAFSGWCTTDDCGSPVHAQRFFMTVSTHPATAASGLGSDSVLSPILNLVKDWRRSTLQSPKSFARGICQRTEDLHIFKNLPFFTHFQRTEDLHICQRTEE